MYMEDSQRLAAAPALYISVVYHAFYVTVSKEFSQSRELCILAQSPSSPKP